MLSGLVDSNGNYLDGEPTAVNVNVPELPTWAMMLAGFAGLGFVGYRRNGKTVRA